MLSWESVDNKIKSWFIFGAIPFLMILLFLLNFTFFVWYTVYLLISFYCYSLVSAVAIQIIRIEKKKIHFWRDSILRSTIKPISAHFGALKMTFRFLIMLLWNGKTLLKSLSDSIYIYSKWTWAQHRLNIDFAPRFNDFRAVNVRLTR